MSGTHEKLVEEQFGPRAKAYVESQVHAAGEDLQALALIVRKAAPAHSLDLGCGGGHVSYLLAEHAQKVTACDLSASMLAAVDTTAKARGLQNVETRQAAAENLPFESALFDFVACRYSAHHWRDFDAGLREARRVVKTASCAIFIDAYAPGSALLDTHLQTIELLRDPSHVRDRKLSEWIDGLERAGFAPTGLRRWRLRMDFDNWTARMAVPESGKAAIRTAQAAASADIRAHFEIECDGSFMLDVMMIESVAA